MESCEEQSIVQVYEQHCAENLNNIDKQVTFVLRLIILLIAIFSSSIVLITIKNSKKSKFWPFKLIFCQVVSEIIDLLLALIFTINSSCWPNVCKIIGYIMHSNWLASLNLMFLQCFLFFCLIQLECLFNFIMTYLKFFIFIFYTFPYAFLFYVYMDDGFGPSGWYLKDGEFNFIFCGFINHLIKEFWVVPVSILFGISIIISIFNACFWVHLQYKKELRYPALRIRSMVIFPLLYFFAWIINFLMRINETDSLEKKYCPVQEKNIFYYIFYSTLNLGFELHLTVGAFLFYCIFKGLFGINSFWDEICFRRKKNIIQNNNKLYLEESDSAIQLE
ncbi:unnamed protein product [Paramecium sonneborni]|uniref:Uncharacterized protein n=1 Tax=Paramecium sonneborni TaxID=65129 RepID=A0A8S1MG27_9CILI|nr:unnamed protein product [Paramecium sonneborni]